MLSSALLVVALTPSVYFGHGFRKKGRDHGNFCKDVEVGLSDDIAGDRIVVPSDDSIYDTSVQQYALSSLPPNTLHPSGIVYAESVGEVQRVVSYATQCGYKVSIRSGGHQYAGLSSCNSAEGKCIQLDVSLMDSLAVDGTSVTIGPGVSLEKLYSELGSVGLFVAAGECSGVQMGGHSQTGGAGIYSRAFGFVSDQVEAFTIVQAGGSVKTVHRPRWGARPFSLNDQLYWAVMGGSAGSWGVVTSYTIRAKRDCDYPESTYYTCKAEWSPRMYLAAAKTLSSITSSSKWETKQAADESIYINVIKRIPVDTNIIDVEGVWAGVSRKPFDARNFGALRAAMAAEGAVNCSSEQLPPSQVIQKYIVLYAPREFPFPYVRSARAVKRPFDNGALEALALALDPIMTSVTNGVYPVHQMATFAGAVNEDTNARLSSVPHRYRILPVFFASAFKCFLKAYLAGLTVVELKALAAELGVVVAGIQRKRELQARILAEKDGEEARAEDADDGDSDEDEDDSDEAEGEAPARAALPANRKPVWRTPPPPTASEAASSFNWLRDPWLFYDTAHREWGPETFRARAAKREAEERFARIRKLTPKIEDALVQEVIDDEIRALIKRKLDQRAVQAVEKKARWADYPSDIRELVEDVDKEVDRQRKETKKTQASRGSGKGAPPAGGQASGPRDDRRTRRGRPLKEIAHIPGAKVQRALLDIIDAAYADSTWQNIAYTHAKWRRYVRKVDLLGATVADQVLSWIGWMQADGLKASSILTEMGNVTAALKLQGVTLEDPRLRMVLKGLAKMKVEQPRDQARPISKRLMWDVVQRAPPKAAAVFAIAWLTCSRIGDVRRTPASDVTLKGELMELSWRQRKDWRNIGVVTTVRTGPWREFVERHLRLLAPTDTLGGDWTTARFASLLPKTYSGHSIRRGAAQFALKHASAESVRTLTLHATLTGLIRYAPLAHRRQQIRASRALADAGTGDEEREP
ncbi:6-hydroxy-D-nicotine oxidase [Diplonema papillatum]|nr:6-hydroxy-D-nicotine oxidase [Diplonema papillatum]